MKTSYRLCSMDATHFSSTYGFSGRHRPQPKARQAADRLVVSGHLCRIGLFNNGARDIEVGPVDRIGAICELGAFPAQACPVRHPRRPPSWFATFSRFRSMIRLTNDSRSVFPVSNCHLGAFGCPAGFSARGRPARPWAGARCTLRRRWAALSSGSCHH